MEPEGGRIVTDVSGLALPGKEAEAVAVAQELAAYLDQRWPAPAPRQVLVDLTGEPGRVHIRAVRASEAEHERHHAEQGADMTFLALLQRLGPLMVPDSDRTTLQRLA